TVTPTGVDDSGSTTAGVQLVVGGSGVLGNDAGTGLTVTTNTQPAHGGVVLQPGGAYVYTPATGFSGVDTFTYTATDADGGTITQTVTVTIDPAPATAAAPGIGGLAST
ncbi:Ig-like domain-containing protein, partial [Rhizobium johnstonii]|uniref:Ig-like domain-containing protein n=1 Tax=Rhizobium johnstonii TaxID=3019933 RepID=UPI003F985165